MLFFYKNDLKSRPESFAIYFFVGGRRNKFTFSPQRIFYEISKETYNDNRKKSNVTSGTHKGFRKLREHSEEIRKAK